MKKLQRIGVASVFRVSLGISAIIGTVIGVILCVGDLIDHNPGLGVVTLVLAPIVYGALFSLGNVLLAWLFNCVAGRLGGIELTLEDD